MWPFKQQPEREISTPIRRAVIAEMTAEQCRFALAELADSPGPHLDYALYNATFPEQDAEQQPVQDPYVWDGHGSQLLAAVRACAETASTFVAAQRAAHSELAEALALSSVDDEEVIGAVLAVIAPQFGDDVEGQLIAWENYREIAIQTAALVDSDVEWFEVYPGMLGDDRAAEAEKLSKDDAADLLGKLIGSIR